MSEGNEENNNKKSKKVVSTDVTDYHTKREYHVRYDDGTKDTHTESKIHLGASRLSRLADFVKNAKVGDIKEDDTSNNKKDSD